VPELLALVIGDGALRPELEERARQLGLEDSVRFLGSRGDVPDLLGALDVLVSASRSEGCPISALEAMAAGVPVLGPRIPAFEEISDDGANAVLVEPSSAPALAEGIVRLVGDAALRRRLADAARAHVTEHHDIRIVAARYERLYEEIARR
jgi:glycosyltransferase involved in cell wall biosynthesis